MGVHFPRRSGHRQLIASALSLAALVTACAPSTTALPRSDIAQRTGVVTVIARQADSRQRSVDYHHRTTADDGSPIAGTKLQGLRRSYWIPDDGRITRYGPYLLVIAYGELLVFSRDVTRARDNETGDEVNLDKTVVEANPVVLRALERALQRKTQSNQRKPLIVGAGSCFLMGDVGCYCWDCLGDFPFIIIPPIVEPLPYPVSGNLVADCLSAGYTADWLRTCLAAGGPGGDPNILFDFIRQNARDYVFYAKSVSTALITENNPARLGATHYAWSYKGLVEDPYTGNGLLPPNAANGDRVAVLIFGTVSGSFSQTRATFYSDSAAVAASRARLARIDLNNFGPS